MKLTNSNITILGHKYTDIGVDSSWCDGIYVPTKQIAKMVRQYIKANYPKVKSWVRIQRYSCGSSIIVSLEKENYEKHHDDLHHELGARFRSRFFNGMVDEWQEKEFYTDKGTRVYFAGDGISIQRKY